MRSQSTRVMGVYAITHLPSGRQYIGSSVNIYRRWSAHRSELTRRIHRCADLQQDWINDSASAFSFSILELVMFRELLDEREQCWLDRHHPVYNHEQITRPRPRSPKQRRKPAIMGIYAVTHIASGYMYIGRTINAKRRFKEHRQDLTKGQSHHPRMQELWNAHGADAFRMEMLEVVDDPRLLPDREQRWIDGSPFLLNSHLSATGPRGHRRSPQTRERMGAASRRRWADAEARERHLAALRTPELRAAASARARSFSEETKRKMSESQRKAWTPERRAQAAERLAARNRSRAGQSAALKQEARQSTGQDGHSSHRRER